MELRQAKTAPLPKILSINVFPVRQVFVTLSLKTLTVLIVFFLNSTGSARMFERKNQTIHVEKPDYHKPWIELSPDPNKSLKKLTHMMSLSPIGKKILKKAQTKASKEGTTLSKVLLPGEKSYTDITLIRKFSKASPQKIQYKSLLRVFINRNLSVQDAVMDMAHELVHYAFRETFNPYRKNFNLKSFITSTIEGRGGEVEAYLAECQVFFELFHKSNQGQTHCHLTLDHKTKKPGRAQTIKLFYRLGKHYQPFLRRIKKHNLQAPFLKHISPKQTLLMSATYDLPYPIAAIHEYDSIHKKTCENELKRLNALPNRKISSVALKSYYQRCKNNF